jgi:hypothetical protein
LGVHGLDKSGLKTQPERTLAHGLGRNFCSKSNPTTTLTNSTLSTIECVRKLCTKLNIIQRDIDSIYHESVHLRQNIIRVCRDHSALTFEMINSITNIFELVNNIYAFIVNYKAVHKLVNQDDYIQSCKKKNMNETYYMNRQYFWNELIFRSRWISREFTYRKFANRESYASRELCRTNSTRESYETESRELFRFKKCFVCDKEECWFINHTIKKRKNSKHNFYNQHLEYREHFEYEQHL